MKPSLTIEDILSLFIPERISIKGDLVEIKFLGKLKYSQQLSGIEAFYFLRKHDFTGTQFINLFSDGKSESYFGDQIGFKAFWKEILKKLELEPHIIDDIIRKKTSSEDFYWSAQSDFEWPENIINSIPDPTP